MATVSVTAYDYYEEDYEQVCYLDGVIYYSESGNEPTVSVENEYGSWVVKVRLDGLETYFSNSEYDRTEESQRRLAESIRLYRLPNKDSVMRMSGSMQDECIVSINAVDDDQIDESNPPKYYFDYPSWSLSVNDISPRINTIMITGLDVWADSPFPEITDLTIEIEEESQTVSKVEYFGKVLLDLTGDTVSPSSLLKGFTAHDKSGKQIVGNAESGGSETKLQSKSVTPTEQSQTVSPDTSFDGLSSVEVGAISSTYVGSGVSRRTSTNMTVSGASVTAPAGYYATAQSKSVATGTAGTPSASKGAVSNNQISITPTVTNTTGYITGGTKTGTVVTVKASDLVSESRTITSNDTYDVTNLASIVVSVASGGGLPSGIQALDYGTLTISSAFTTSRQTYTHKLGVIPDFVMVYSPTNVAQSYSMLMAMRGSVFGWRSSSYNCHMFYHGNNSSTTVSYTNSSSTTLGVCTLTATSFQLASASSSYYWRAGSYRYLAIKFA